MINIAAHTNAPAIPCAAADLSQAGSVGKDGVLIVVLIRGVVVSRVDCVVLVPDRNVVASVLTNVVSLAAAMTAGLTRYANKIHNLN